MTDSIEAYPLHWPHGWPRTKHHHRSRYSTDYSAALSGLQRELRLLGARRVIISTNVPVRQDGLPYADGARRKIVDPGVAVYFQRQGSPQVIACDKWDRVQDNIHAVELTVAALRGIRRAGASELLDRAFAGFKSLPAAGDSSEGRDPWWEVLGVDEGADRETVKRAYREHAKRHHPDVGGSPAQWHRIQRAYEEATLPR